MIPYDSEKVICVFMMQTSIERSPCARHCTGCRGRKQMWNKAHTWRKVSHHDKESSLSQSRGVGKHEMELGQVVQGFLGGLGQEGPDVFLWGEGE